MSEEFKEYQINISPEYDTKFDKIIDDMIKNAPQKAKYFLNVYENMLCNLTIFPDSGITPQNERLKRLCYRYKIVEDFIIFYTFFNNNIMLMQIFNHSENYKEYSQI